MAHDDCNKKDGPICIDARHLPAPWSDEWIESLADEFWNPSESYKAACCGFARAIAARAMEEAAEIAERGKVGLDGPVDTGKIWRNAAYDVVGKAIRARAQEITNGR